MDLCCSLPNAKDMLVITGHKLHPDVLSFPSVKKARHNCDEVVQHITLKRRGLFLVVIEVTYMLYCVKIAHFMSTKLYFISLNATFTSKLIINSTQATLF